MAVIDLWADATASLPADCDVCVVGTGPAGATVAAELAATDARVVLLESGAAQRRADVDELTAFESVGRPRSAPWSVRNRIAGGSSHTWGGRSAPFDEIDLEERPWVPWSGWPIDQDELDVYLERSAGHQGLALGTGFSDERFWDLAPQARPARPVDPALLRPFFWQFSRDPHETYPYEYRRFGRDLAERLGPHQTLVLGATVLEVVPRESGDRVAGVAVVLPDGQRREITARIVVLCAGGIDNPRILLSSDSVTPNGLGNDHDLVGRFLMDHPRGVTATFDGDLRVLQRRLLRHTARGRLFRAGFRLSPDLQREEGLLNAAAWLGERIAADDPWDAVRRAIRGDGARTRAVRDAVGNAGLVVQGVRDYFVHRTGVPRKLEGLDLLVMCEQLPDPESRLRLSDVRDRRGQRLPVLDWRVHPEEARAVRRLTEVVVAEFARTGLPVPEVLDWVRDGAELPESWVDVAHPTGTTRMSTDPRTGVVDAWGEVRGVDGLFVVGSSTFPTAGHCNPTQMIVALAARTADAVRGRWAAPESVAAAPATDAGDARPSVLVTGGTGRIGRVVVDELTERGWRVRATTSGAPRDDDTVEWITLDLATAEAADVDAAVAGVDAVIHLAAALGRPETMPRINTVATGLLAQAAERAGVRSFVYTSTVSVYGSPRARDAAEDGPVLSLDRDDPEEYLAMDYVRQYGRTKLAGEVALAEAATATRYTVFRPSVVVSVDQLLEVRDWSRSKRLLAAHRRTHHVFVRDVADALVWATERNLAGTATAPGSIETFNLAEDEPEAPTYADFMAEAYAVSADPRFRTVVVPGAADWLQDMARFRRFSTRNPLWRTRFPVDRLSAAGYRPRYGMAYARSVALRRLHDERVGA